MLKYVLAILAGLYGVSPVDIVPEFFLGWVGWIDDIIIFYLLWRFYFSTNRQPWKKKGGPSHGESERERRTNGTAADSADPDGPTDPHEVLGVPPNASEAEIKQAYRTLAGRYHPDKVNHLGEEFRDLAEKRFKEIQAAYDALVRR